MPVMPSVLEHSLQEHPLGWGRQHDQIESEFFLSSIPKHGISICSQSLFKAVGELLRSLGQALVCRGIHEQASILPYSLVFDFLNFILETNSSSWFCDTLFTITSLTEGAEGASARLAERQQGKSLYQADTTATLYVQIDPKCPDA